MEWAIGKQYDIYRAGRRQIDPTRIANPLGNSYSRRGEPIRDHVELGVYLYPKGLCRSIGRF